METYTEKLKRFSTARHLFLYNSGHGWIRCLFFNNQCLHIFVTVDLHLRRNQHWISLVAMSFGLLAWHSLYSHQQASKQMDFTIAMLDKYSNLNLDATNLTPYEYKIVPLALLWWNIQMVWLFSLLEDAGFEFSPNLQNTTWTVYWWSQFFPHVRIFYYARAIASCKQVHCMKRVKQSTFFSQPDIWHL